MDYLSKKSLLTCSLLFLTLIVLPQNRSLEYYIDAGIKNSPLLADLKNQLASSTVDSLIVRAERKPQIEGRSQALYSPSYHNFGYDEVVTDGGNYQAVAAVTQNIFNRKDLENRLQALEIQKQSVGNNVRLSIADLKKTITDQYITSYSDLYDLQFNHSFLELMNHENELVKQFVISGIASQSDYLALQVETQGQQVLVNQLKTQFYKDLSLMNQLCGLEDTVAYELQEPQIDISSSSEAALSPFFRQFIIDSMKLVNERIALDVKYRPRVNWFADAGALSSRPDNIYRHFGYSVGASLSVPIYDGQQKNLELRKLSISTNTISSYRSTYRKKYDQMLFQLNDELKGTESIKAQIRKQLETADQLVSSLKAQLEAGQVKMTDYVNAIKNYRNINRNLNLVNIRMFQIRNEISYLLTR
ncbi:MAG: TolC family protein [Bacteroidota bacterium]|nr:TolC family protein [Bacteroidota bacterium]